MAGRRKHSREFKREAVRMVVDRSVTMVQVARDLELNVNVLRGWVKADRADPAHAFPGVGQQKPDDVELTQLRREVARLKMERDILKKSRGLLCEGAAVYFGDFVSLILINRPDPRHEPIPNGATISTTSAASLAAALPLARRRPRREGWFTRLDQPVLRPPTFPKALQQASWAGRS